LRTSSTPTGSRVWKPKVGIVGGSGRSFVDRFRDDARCGYVAGRIACSLDVARGKEGRVVTTERDEMCDGPASAQRFSTTGGGSPRGDFVGFSR
jgi:hypothetical protein